MSKRTRPKRTYIGVDVGGTKIQASLVEESGTTLGRERTTTPRDVGPEQVVAAIEKLMEKVLKQNDFRVSDLAGIGIAVPGVVDPDNGRVVVTPNMSLSGVALGEQLEARFGVPLALGNDCNLGTLGEAWLGSARRAESVVGILVGTGIGSGFVRNGKLWRGARESAGEIGHMVMQIGGPKCGCGNRGCLEALASRTAIERELRQAVAAGRKTVLTESRGDDLRVIRSNELRRALDVGDELVTEVIRHAAEVLGYACLSVRHLIDPEVIVLGGGVIKACSDYMLPVVEQILDADQLPGAREGGGVRLSALGDDAVVLGAVALAQRRAGRNPFKKRFSVRPVYPRIVAVDEGSITVGRKTYCRDVVLLADGSVEKRKKSSWKHGEHGHDLSLKELAKLCVGGPETLFFGTGHRGQLQLGEEGQRFLRQRSIQWSSAPTSEAAAAYNKCKKRKAALLHVGC